jgi:hypothetical protein
MRRASLALVALAIAASALASAEPAPSPLPVRNPFDRFDLPDAWEARFWADPGVKALLRLDPRALADLVPVQAGVRFCRCPNCDAPEADDPLAWSATKPQVLTCRRCGVSVPNETYPAKNDKKVPEETIEVLPRLIHHYPYHAVELEKQQYPEERLYLAAKRDYEAREFLAKAALYAAVRHREQPPRAKEPALARLACVLLLRFAQVYPAYATHYDQPDSPKLFQQADLPPPYQRGYKTGKWDWTASLDVPLNLVIAYALVRDDLALVEAGRRLGEPNPARVIERDLFRASAEFVRLQTEEFSEMSLHAYRGMLAVARLLDDAALMHEVLGRLEGFAERGFYHDGFWRQGDASAHRRVVGLIDGWIDRMLAGYADPPDFVAPRGERRLEGVPGVAQVPMLARARLAGAALLGDPRAPEVQQAAWPAVAPRPVARVPVLLGGVGLARLALGQGDDTLDLELRGLGHFGSPHDQRQALRLAIAGRPVLGDLDETTPMASGWDRATVSHNTVVVDGLNQRESLAKAREPALGGDFLFFAADPDFQVATLDDPRAYPQSTTRYRQTLVAASGTTTRYALSVFEVHGGLQHDQVYHAAAGSLARWQVSVPLAPGPSTLMPPSITYVPTVRAEDDRWFVQAYGEFTPLGQGTLERPGQAWLVGPDARGVRLHLLNEMSLVMMTAVSPDPTAPTPRGSGRDAGRAGLILRHRSEDGATLKSRFVTVFEPVGPTPRLLRVGRIASGPETVVIYLETAEGPEHVVVNLAPGTTQTVTCVDGRPLRTDGRTVRVMKDTLILAGGTFAETAGRRVAHAAVTGKITGAIRGSAETGRGFFLADAPLPDAPSLVGRVLLVRHGDGPTRGWTLDKVENTPDGARLFVREEPGFLIEPRTGQAQYYQFPRNATPPPHRFSVPRISRTRR